MRNLRVLAVVSVVLVGLTLPAVAAPASTGTLEGLVGRVVTELAPFAAQRGVTLELDANGATAVSLDEQVAVHDRFLNLIANAVALAPAHQTLRVSVIRESVRIWIANASEAYSVDRTVQDATGNDFRIRTVEGSGTELSASLDKTVVEAP
ncbi:MAG: hypothetical protein EB084_09830 [Proteobacteria bacterium]|nr:hypothetical protein [Pseudomonadota bacterium]